MYNILFIERKNSLFSLFKRKNPTSSEQYKKLLTCVQLTVLYVIILFYVIKQILK